jgi:Asp-tRNA(Asn)/Glu-tRNA(Gln) amidotransferase A subunit family amidase
MGGTVMGEPCDLGAVQARRLMAEKRLSPVELLESCIRRIEAVDGAVNAMVARCFERARAEAKSAEAAIMGGQALGLLHGLPMGVKDLNVTADLRTTFGSLLYEHHVPDTDERIVADLRRAGAIVVGKTNTPEFGAGANTVNKVYGATRNPFDTALSCAGSSGGSAVAVATGMTPICTGSDTGGSLRTPASFCGITSIRGTPGLVPSDRRVLGLTTYNVQGPMARDVPDASLMLAAMAGDDSCDPLATPVDPEQFQHVDELDLSSLRVAISEDLGFASIDNGVREVFRERVAKFSHLFAECGERDPDMEHASRVFWLIRGVHFLASHAARYRDTPDMLGPNVTANVKAALEMTSTEIAWAYAECTRIYRGFQRFFDEVDVLICPTAAVPPFPVEQLYCDEINGEKLANYVKWLDIVGGITLTGHPVVQLPCGRGPTGMPFGLQIVGPRLHSDRFVIAVAAALERFFSDVPDLARPLPDIAALSRSR